MRPTRNSANFGKRRIFADPVRMNLPASKHRTAQIDIKWVDPPPTNVSRLPMEDVP
jgi:hypothetical protein